MALLSSFAGLTFISSVPGLAGKFFNGDYSSLAASGSIGTLPLDSTNNSSNLTTNLNQLPSIAHASGVNIWPSISWAGPLGDTYGFIAIGYFVPPTTGTYTFYTYSDDNSGVWLGPLANATSGRTYLNATLNNNLEVPLGQSGIKRSASIVLTGAQSYAIRIVYQESGGGDSMIFSWSGPGISETTNLLDYFYVPGSPTATTRNF
jgi:hypothetical protein